MKSIIAFVLILLSTTSIQAQLIAKVQLKEKVVGICDHDNIYSLFNHWDGQVEPKCSISKEEMQEELNKIQYLKDHPKFKGKGMIGMYVNCKGEVVGWRISIKLNEDIDAELLKVFKTFNEWTAGTLNGKSVDSDELFSYKIKKGVLTLN